MHITDALIDYHHQLLKKTEALVDQLKEKKTGPGIHHLRVRIKKLNAFYRLLALLDPRFNKKKYFSRFKKIAKTTNYIRDIQVQLGMLNSPAALLPVKDSGFITFLKNKENEKLTDFDKMLRGWDAGALKEAHKKIKKRIQKLDNKKVSKSISRILNNSLEELRKFAVAGQKYKTEQLHDFRKMVKTQVYSMKLFAKISDQPLEIPMETLNKLQDVIGHWHDNEITLDFLKEYFHQNNIAPQQQAPMKKAIRDAQNLLESQINILMAEI